MQLRQDEAATFLAGVSKLRQQPVLSCMVHSSIEIAGKLFTQGHRVRMNHGSIGLIGNLPSGHKQSGCHNRIFSDDDIRGKASYLVQSAASVGRKAVGKKGRLDSKLITRSKVANVGGRGIVEQSRMALNWIGLFAPKLPSECRSYKWIVEGTAKVLKRAELRDGVLCHVQKDRRRRQVLAGDLTCAPVPEFLFGNGHEPIAGLLDLSLSAIRGGRIDHQNL